MENSGDETLMGDTAEGVPSLGVAPERGRGLQRGDRLGRYTVLELLGHGGMGLVYTAYDPQLDRRVAVKVLRARGTHGATERARQRLLREAQAMAKLSHPNVVTVHDVGTLMDGEVFIAMEFVDGDSLDRWLQKQPRAWREVVAVFADAGRGLAAAHAAGLVHRDFKPANVLLDRAGRARVTDFGLAQIGDASSIASGELSGEFPAEVTGRALLLTEGDAVLGTPAYMAPEQHARTGVDARTDQFGFCVALYEALFSHHPFGGETLVALAAAVSQGELREVPGDTDVPAHVRRAVMRGLAHEPDARWPDMDALLAALLDDPARRRRRWLVGAAAVAGLAGLVALSVRAVPPAPEPPPPCEGAGDDVDAVWSPARRDAIAEAFAATKQPHAATVWARSTEVLDGYATRWRGSALDACEATRVRGEQSDSLFDLRRACLDRRLHELDVRLALLEEVDAEMVDHGFDVATSLAPIDVCEDAERLRATVPLPEDPGRAAQVEALIQQLASLRASLLAGRAAEIEDQMQAAVKQAVALGHAPTRAEARYLASAVEEVLGHWKEGEELAWLAAQDAAEGHDDRLLAAVWANLPHLVGYLQARFTDAELLAPGARAALARAGRPDDLMAGFEQGMGSMRMRQGDRQTARLHYLEALARLHEDGGNALARSHVLNNLGVLHMLDGDYDRAREWFERAHSSQAGLLRPDHPDNASYLQNLGNLAAAQADFTTARARYGEALALVRASKPDGGPEELSLLINRAQLLAASHCFDESRIDLARSEVLIEQLYGPGHPASYLVWAGRARLERELGRLDDARAAIEKAVELGRAALGDDHHDVGILHYEAAAISLARGELDEAAAQADRAVAASTAGYGGEHPQTAAILRLRGSVDLARGELPMARERLERAVELLERRHGDAQELARGRFDLARCLPASERARARRLAGQARERLVTDASKAEVAAIDAWLAEHPK